MSIPLATFCAVSKIVIAAGYALPLTADINGVMPLASLQAKIYPYHFPIEIPSGKIFFKKKINVKKLKNSIYFTWVLIFKNP